jgi:hypothetical protein
LRSCSGPCRCTTTWSSGKATAAATKLGKITDKECKEYRDLQVQVEAYVVNISADVLKPKVG